MTEQAKPYTREEWEQMREDVRDGYDEELAVTIDHLFARVEEERSYLAVQVEATRKAERERDEARAEIHALRQCIDDPDLLVERALRAEREVERTKMGRAASVKTMSEALAAKDAEIARLREAIRNYLEGEKEAIKEIRKIDPDYVPDTLSSEGLKEALQ